MKRRYELTVIFSSQLSQEDLTKANKFVEKLFEKKGKIVKKNDWGKLNFSYPIAKQTEGEYRHYIVELEGGKIPEITSEFALNEGILRHLLVREGE